MASVILFGNCLHALACESTRGGFQDARPNIVCRRMWISWEKQKRWLKCWFVCNRYPKCRYSINFVATEADFGNKSRSFFLSVRSTFIRLVNTRKRSCVSVPRYRKVFSVINWWHWIQLTSGCHASDVAFDVNGRLNTCDTEYKLFCGKDGPNLGQMTSSVHFHFQCNRNNIGRREASSEIINATWRTKKWPQPLLNLNRCSLHITVKCKWFNDCMLCYMLYVYTCDSWRHSQHQWITYWPVFHFANEIYISRTSVVCRASSDSG